MNYTKAANYAISRLSELPLCNRLIKETHAVLLQGVRGQNKNPGEFRQSQNWIGAAGSTIQTARYIPPSIEDIPELLSHLEKYINSDDTLDYLIQAALIHYQFETIHPFLDGNGRIGRLMIILFLLEKKVMSAPALYISYYLKMNRIEYYDRINEVRRKGNYEQWIKFFLTAVECSANDAVQTIKKLSALRKQNEQIITEFGKSVPNALKLLRFIESEPIIDTKKTADALEMSYNTVSGLIKRFEEKGILVQSENKKRNKTYVYREYLELLKKGTVPNANTIQAIQEVEALKKDSNKKVYSSFSDVLEELDNG